MPRPKMTFADLDPPATEHEATVWPTAAHVYRARKRAARAAYLRTRPAHRLTVLAYDEPGAAIDFPEYQRGAQLSGLLRELSESTGAEFSTSVQTSLIDGARLVRVTLKRRATRGQPPEVTPDVNK